jgi:hypothetical protein
MDPTNKWFFEVRINTESNRTLILQACDEQERTEWMVALSLHKNACSSRSQVVALTDHHVLTGVDGGCLTMEDFDLQGVVGIGAWGKATRASANLWHATSGSDAFVQPLGSIK